MSRLIDTLRTEYQKLPAPVRRAVVIAGVGLVATACNLSAREPGQTGNSEALGMNQPTATVVAENNGTGDATVEVITVAPFASETQALTNTALPTTTPSETMRPSMTADATPTAIVIPPIAPTETSTVPVLPSVTAIPTGSPTRTLEPTPTITSTPTPTRENQSIFTAVGVLESDDEGHTLNRTDFSMVRASGQELLANWDRSEELETVYGEDYRSFNESYGVLSGAVPVEITGDPNVTVLFGLDNELRDATDIQTLRLDFGRGDIESSIEAQEYFDSVATTTYFDENGELRRAYMNAPETMNMQPLWFASGEDQLRSRVNVQSLRDLSFGLNSVFLGLAQTANTENMSPIRAERVLAVAQRLTNDVLARDWELDEVAVRPIMHTTISGELVSSGFSFAEEIETCRVEEQVDTVTPTFGERLDQPEHTIRVPVYADQTSTEAAPYGNVGENAVFSINGAVNWEAIRNAKWSTEDELYALLYANVNILVLGDEVQGVDGVPAGYEQSPVINSAEYTEFTTIVCGARIPRGEETDTPEETIVYTPPAESTFTPTSTEVVITPTPTVRITEEPAPTNTHEFTPIPETTPTPGFTQTDIPVEDSPTPRPTSTPRPTETPRPTHTPRPTSTVAPTATVRPSETPRPTVTMTPFPTETLQPAPTNTDSFTEVPPVTATQGVTPTDIPVDG